MTAVAVDSLSFGYEKGIPVLAGISFSVNEGERWAIIGKNGCGKSTLLKCIGNLLPAELGGVKIRTKPVTAYRPLELAKLVAYVPQAIGRMLPPYSVRDFAMLGRFPYQGFFARPATKDRKIVREALQLTDTESLGERWMNTLSGGELQRVFLAAAVAQRTAILLLDEPMSFLDPLHQSLVQRSLDRIHDEYNTTIVTVTHDINLALRRHSHVCAIVKGKQFFAGTTREFGENAHKLLEEIYSIKFIETTSYKDETKYFVPESIS